MKLALHFTLPFFLIVAFTTRAAEEERPPLFETFDLTVGETVVTASGVKLTLVSVNEPVGEVWGEISRPEVTVSVDGENATLVAGMYRLPEKVGKVQLDCPITGGLRDNSHIDHWALETDARIRVWPVAILWNNAGSPVTPLFRTSLLRRAPTVSSITTPVLISEDVKPLPVSSPPRMPWSFPWETGFCPVMKRRWVPRSTSAMTCSTSSMIVVGTIATATSIPSILQSSPDSR